MYHAMSVEMKNLIAQDKPSALILLNISLYKAKVYYSRDKKEVLSLIISYNATACMIEFVKKFGKIDIEEFIKKGNYSLFLTAQRFNLVVFKRTGGRNFTNRLLDIPTVNTDSAYYLKLAIRYNKVDFVKYFLRADLSVLQILNITQKEYDQLANSLTKLKLHKSAKEGNIRIPILLLKATIKKIELDGETNSVLHTRFSNLLCLYQKRVNKIERPTIDKSKCKHWMYAIKNKDESTIRHMLRDRMSLCKMLMISEEMFIKGMPKKDISNTIVHKLIQDGFFRLAILIAEAAINEIIRMRNNDKVSYRVEKLYTDLNKFVNINIYYV